MSRYSRVSIALLLTVIYTLIIMSPLAPLALTSARVAHAVTGECSGDCDICGCSLERRADRTCCCWQKKMKQEHAHDHEQEKLPDCCKKKQTSAKPELTCTCPCGSAKLFGLWGSEKFEQLPYRFTEGIIGILENASFAFHNSRQTDRFGDPPDPPPKLLFSV